MKLYRDGGSGAHRAQLNVLMSLKRLVRSARSKPTRYSNIKETLLTLFLTNAFLLVALKLGFFTVLFSISKISKI